MKPKKQYIQQVIPCTADSLPLNHTPKPREKKRPELEAAIKLGKIQIVAVK